MIMMQWLMMYNDATINNNVMNDGQYYITPLKKKNLFTNSMFDKCAISIWTEAGASRVASRGRGWRGHR